MADLPTRRWAFLILAWMCLSVGVSAQVQSECRNDSVWIRGAFGEARFSVEIADDPRERALGLMHRTEMAASEGMLFVYPNPQPLSFWMRNTLIPLDMIFVAPTGVIKHIHHRAKPLDETPIPGGDGLTHVLEINGGLSQMLGLNVGSQLRHPSFDRSIAAWPC